MDQTPLCSFCQSINETLDHLFSTCTFTETFWNDFYNFFKQSLCLFTQPILHDILFGNDGYSDIHNHLILIAKRHIYAMKMKQSKPLFAAYMLQVKFNYHLEYEIALERDKLERHCSKWISILHTIVEK